MGKGVFVNDLRSVDAEPVCDAGNQCYILNSFFPLSISIPTS